MSAVGPAGGVFVVLCVCVCVHVRVCVRVCACACVCANLQGGPLSPASTGCARPAPGRPDSHSLGEPPSPLSQAFRTGSQSLSSPRRLLGLWVELSIKGRSGGATGRRRHRRAAGRPQWGLSPLLLSCFVGSPNPRARTTSTHSHSPATHRQLCGPGSRTKPRRAALACLQTRSQVRTWLWKRPFIK